MIKGLITWNVSLWHASPLILIRLPSVITGSVAYKGPRKDEKSLQDSKLEVDAIIRMDISFSVTDKDGGMVCSSNLLLLFFKHRKTVFLFSPLGKVTTTGLQNE